jgi:hypothetical protein
MLKTPPGFEKMDAYSPRRELLKHTSRSHFPVLFSVSYSFPAGLILNLFVGSFDSWLYEGRVLPSSHLTGSSATSTRSPLYIVSRISLEEPTFSQLKVLTSRTYLRFQLSYLSAGRGSSRTKSYMFFEFQSKMKLSTALALVLCLLSRVMSAPFSISGHKSRDFGLGMLDNIIIGSHGGPSPIQTDQTMINNFELYSQYSAAAYCVDNNDSPSTQIKCSQGNCPLVEAANATGVLEFHK